MKTDIDLDELEKRAFKSTFEDGLWDMYLGLMLLPLMVWFVMVSVTDLPDVANTIIAMSLLLLPLAGFWLGKKYIVAPRLGMVTFSPARQKKRKKLSLVLALSVLVTFLLVLMTGLMLFPVWENAPSWAFLVLLFGVNIIVVFSLGAYYLDFPRAYLYGWFYAITVASTFWQLDRGLHIPVIGLILAGIMVGIGLVLFVRFWRSHPLPKERVS